MTLTTLRATDPENNPITFSIDTEDFFDIEVIGPNEVKVVHTSNLDFERVREVRFKVTARDDASNSKVGSCASAVLMSFIVLFHGS